MLGPYGRRLYRSRKYRVDLFTENAFKLPSYTGAHSSFIAWCLGSEILPRIEVIELENELLYTILLAFRM